MKKILIYLLYLHFLFLWGSAYPGKAFAESNERSQLRDLLRAEPNIVLDVLRDHPLELLEILEKALVAKRELDRRQMEQADLATRHDPIISAHRPIRGNPNAPVTIVEYSDFLCPFCSNAAQTIKELLDKQKDAVRLVYKHLPLNPVSRELALGFEALALQDHDAAWKLHDTVFARQAEARADYKAVLADVVRQAGVDPDRFATDRSSKALAELLEKDADEARRFGFSGAPMFLINGVPLRGAVPLHEFQRLIELVRPEPEAAAAR